VVGIAVASVIVSPILALLVVKHADAIASIVPPGLQSWHKSYVNTMRALRIFQSNQGFLKTLTKRTHVRWFLNKLRENYRDLTSVTTSATLNRLAPWDEYLSEIIVEQSSHCEGKSLEELNTRTVFQINIVGVERNMNSQIPPDPKLRLLPGDALLAYGTEQNLEAFAKLCRPLSSEQGHGKWLSLQDCDLHAIKLTPAHVFVGKTLRELNLRVAKSVTVLAVVRDGDRLKNPPADLSLQAGDEVFVVGPRTALSALPNL
jgi:Trk K+ transport system NAD-binding subunit